MLYFMCQQYTITSSNITVTFKGISHGLKYDVYFGWKYGAYLFRVKS